MDSDYKRDTSTIILAGGPGRRIGPLTLYRSKPAIRFGPGVICDFAVANAEPVSSAIWIATQYRPSSFEEYYARLKQGRFGGGMGFSIRLPQFYSEDPYFNGTADAALKILETMYRKGQLKKYVLVLSGDHIYQTDFKEMIDSCGDVDFMIAEQQVSAEEAERFGILEKDGRRVVGFSEKPSGLPTGSYPASLGIYLAKGEFLLQYLKDAIERHQSRFDIHETWFDFGRHVIPAMVNDAHVVGHTLAGYWRDVGTVHSYRDSVMDIFVTRNPDLFGPGSNFIIQTEGVPRWNHSPGSYFFSSRRDTFKDSTINNSVFSPGCHVSGSTVLDSLVLGGSMPHTTIKNSRMIAKAIIDRECTIDDCCLTTSHDKVVVVVRGTQLKGVTIESSEDAIVISERAWKEHRDKLRRYKQNVLPNVEFYDENGKKLS